MADALVKDLPRDLPSFLARFGTYAHCRAYLVDPDPRQLEGDVAADEAHVGGRRPGKRGRGAAGKTVVAGGTAAAPGDTKKRELGRLRLATVALAAGADLERFITANVAQGSAITTAGWRGYGGFAAAGYDHHAIGLARSWGQADQRLPAVHLVFGLAKRWLLGTHHGAVSAKYLQRYLDDYVFRFNRRRAKSPAHGFARVLQNAVRIPPATHRAIVAVGAT
ncbi:MAG: IS1595 family transposase [Alphaproteobacteria bacterium]